MFFFVKDYSKVTNGIETVLSNIAEEYHGEVFIEFQEVIDFLEMFLKRLNEFIENSYDMSILGNAPLVTYYPTIIKDKGWIDITIKVGDILTCKIIKAKSK